MRRKAYHMLHVLLIRPPQDVDVLAVLDFQILCFRPETPILYPISLLTKKVKEPGRWGRLRLEEPWFCLSFMLSLKGSIHSLLSHNLFAIWTYNLCANILRLRVYYLIWLLVTPINTSCECTACCQSKRYPNWTITENKNPMVHRRWNIRLTCQAAFIVTNRNLRWIIDLVIINSFLSC